jgi:hypothetical protein
MATAGEVIASPVVEEAGTLPAEETGADALMHAIAQPLAAVTAAPTPQQYVAEAAIPQQRTVTLTAAVNIVSPKY